MRIHSKPLDRLLQALQSSYNNIYSRAGMRVSGLYIILTNQPQGTRNYMLMSLFPFPHLCEKARASRKGKGGEFRVVGRVVNSQEFSTLSMTRKRGKGETRASRFLFPPSIPKKGELI
nr:MAG TPA: hypothetical protein [Caudoviricetes sp.]